MLKQVQHQAAARNAAQVRCTKRALRTQAHTGSTAHLAHCRWPAALPRRPRSPHRLPAQRQPLQAAPCQRWHCSMGVRLPQAAGLSHTSAHRTGCAAAVQHASGKGLQQSPTQTRAVARCQWQSSRPPTQVSLAQSQLRSAAGAAEQRRTHDAVEGVLARWQALQLVQGCGRPGVCAGYSRLLVAHAAVLQFAVAPAQSLTKIRRVPEWGTKSG